MKEKLKLIIAIIVTILLLVGIGVVVYKGVGMTTEKQTNPIASFDIQDYGTVKIELYPEYAPNTVSNFIKLIETGFYNNKVVYGKDSLCLYMARDVSEDAEGPKVSLIDDSIEEGSDDDYEYEIDGEFVANGFEQNTLRHEKGVVSFNRSDYSSYGKVEEGYNSGSYRFSVMMDESSNLNGVYCAFGRVIEGMDILENIYNNEAVSATEDEENSENSGDSIQEFEKQIVFSNASVETYGVDYGTPEVHEAFDIQSYLNDLYSQYLNY